MNILITTSGLPPGAGIGTYVHNLAAWLASKGHEVTVCRSAPVGAALQKSKVYRTLDIPVPPEVADESSSIAELHSLIVNLSPHVIINNDNIFLANLLPCLPPEIVCISVIHGYRKSLASWDGHRVIFSAGLLHHRYLDYIVAISTPMKKAVLEVCRCPEEKVQLIFNGVPVSQEDIRGHAQSSSGVARIAFAGGASRTKGADVMASAVEILSGPSSPAFDMNWLGYLPDRGRVSNSRLANMRNVSSLGKLTHDEVMALLDETDILVMPSRAEGCPMLLLEAMSKGVVPVVSDCPSAMVEIVAAAGCGLVVPTGSPDKLASALRALLTDNRRHEVLSANAIAFFQNNLTMDHCGELISRLFSAPSPLREKNRVAFPPTTFTPYHRRPYPSGSPLSPPSVLQRVRQVFGWLPSPRKFKIRRLIETETSP